MVVCFVMCLCAFLCDSVRDVVCFAFCVFCACVRVRGFEFVCVTAAVSHVCTCFVCDVSCEVVSFVCSRLVV